MKAVCRLSLGVLLTCSLLAALGLVACGGEEATTEPAASAPPPPPPPPPPAPATMERDGLKLTAMPDSPKFPGASLSLDGIEDGQKLPSGTVAFNFAVENYELGTQTSDATTNGIANSGDGQHIHLILNNGPYSAHYGPTFEKEMEDGQYLMVAFLSRSYHESVKEPSALVVKSFSVGDAEPQEMEAGSQHMFYSRPKGVYKGDDTQKLMLDFYLFNTSISASGNKVRATINGTEFVLTEWVPYVIEGLPLGEVTIRLELIDAEGNLVPGPYNDVTRTVTLEAGA